MPARCGGGYPLWSPDRPAPDLLDRIVGEVGPDFVLVPVVTGPRHAFRAATLADVEPAFSTDGGWHYPPRAAAFEGGDITPRAARWCGKRDPLAALQTRLVALGLDLLVQLDLRAATPALEAHPHLLRRDAWGATPPWLGACPASPALRELLRLTLIDLQRYAPAGHELLRWTGDRAAVPGPLAWHPVADQLAATCFCAACRQTAVAAGVDPDAAARCVRVETERALTRPPATALPPEDELLARYRTACAADQARWLAELAAAGSPEARWLGVDEPAPDAAPPAGWEWRGRVRDLRADTRAQALPSQVLLPCWHPGCPEAADLVRSVHELVERGVTTILFDDLLTAPPDALTWVRQAVRFARRG